MHKRHTLKMAAALGVTFALALTGCSSGTPGANGGPGATPGAAEQRVAFITINEQDVFFVDLTKGLQKIAAENGIELAITDPAGDVNKQIDAIETYTSSGYDVIIIDAVDSNAVVPALAAARKAGVKVVSVDGVIEDSSAIDTQVGADNAKIGAQLGKLARDYVTDNLDGKAIVGIVTVLQSQIQLARADGFKKGLQGVPGVEVQQPVNGGYSTDTALTAAENLFSAQPKMKIAYATGQGTVLGLIAANQAQRRDVKIFGWNLDDKIAAAIKSGDVIATVQQEAGDFGEQAMKAALSLLKGDDVPALVEVPVTIVTKDNVAKYFK